MAGIRTQPASAGILSCIAWGAWRMAGRIDRHECLSAQDRQTDIQTQICSGVVTVRRRNLGLGALALSCNDLERKRNFIMNDETTTLFRPVGPKELKVNIL